MQVPLYVIVEAVSLLMPAYLYNMEAFILGKNGLLEMSPQIKPEYVEVWYMKLTIHLQQVLRSRKCGPIQLSHTYLHDVVLNYLSTGTALPYIC
jgi:hypothetical protein